MAEKVTRVGIKKEKRWFYFVDGDGDISRTRMVKKGSTAAAMPSEKVHSCGIKKEPSYLYIVDKDGDVSRILRNRRRMEEKCQMLK